MARYEKRGAGTGEHGLFIDVEVACVNQRKPVSVLAMLDTGAARSMIAQSIVDELGLVAHDRIDLVTFNRAESCWLYEAYLLLNDGAEFPVIVAGGAFPKGPDLVLGRDVLQCTKLTYDGPLGAYVVEF